MPKALETPTPPHSLCQGSSHRRRIHGCGFAGSRDCPSVKTRAPEVANCPTKFTCLLYNIIISGLARRVVRTCSRPQTLLQHHFFPHPRHVDSLPQTISSPRGPLRLMFRRPESFKRGTTEPKHSSRRAVQGWRPAPPCQHACCMLARTFRVGTVRVRQTVPSPRFVDRRSSCSSRGSLTPS